MEKLSITLLLNFFTLISTRDGEPRDIFTKTTYYEAITEDKAAESLRVIESTEALPLVLYVDNTSPKFDPPEALDTVFVGNKRIIYPTQFTSRRAGEQVFFCPKADSDEKCLVRKDFHPLEPLECSKEPELVVAQDESEKKLGCGPNNAGEPYYFVYEICPNEIVFPETSDNFSNRNVRLYEFCYDEKANKVLGTLHQITHPKLLGSKILSLERSVHYHMKTMDGFILADQHILETAIAEEELSSTSSDDDSENQYKKQKTNQHVYRAQKLVPEEDMAFALRIKPIFQYLNFQMQHEKLIPLWNEINLYIRLYAEERFTSKIIMPYVTTSVVQLTTVPRDDGQMSNIWGKLIYFTEKSMLDSSSKIIDALVILMNNYIDIKNDHASSSNLEEKTIDNYCQEDTCEESLKSKFAAVGGSVRCCAMTDNVSEIFGSRVHKIKEISRIPGINGIEHNIPFEKLI